MTSERQPIPLSRLLLVLLALVAGWLLWSGLYKPLLLFFGVLSCAICFWLARRIGVFDDQMYSLRLSGGIFRYWLWLGGQILRSSIDVTRIVLHPKLPISPRVVDIKASSDRPFDHVMLGNSITLTPGPLALDVHEGVVKVHALTEEGANELLAGEMDRRVAALPRD